MEATLDIRKNAEACRYELNVDGKLAGRATYREEGNTVVFPSVVISRERRGQGLGEKLTKFALDDAIASGKSVLPVCPFVVTYIRRHPEYKGHVAPAQYTPSDGDACELENTSD